jgi:hypothetical protein
MLMNRTRLQGAALCLSLGLLGITPAISRADPPPPDRQQACGDFPIEHRTLLADVTFGPPASGQDDPAQPAVRLPPRRHTVRALLEMGSFISFSAASYWSKYASFIEDWQFRLTWKDQTRKFFTSEGLRLDSNNMRLNWTHAPAGGIYYSFARSNGLGTAGSFLFSAGGSLFWEYVVEWREISSINDHISTAVGGPAIAEPLFQISSYFRNRPGLANRVATLVTNPLVAINDVLDGKSRPPRVPTDQWHDFRLSTGGLTGVNLPDSHAAAQNVVTLDMRLVTLPDYGKVGAGSERFRDTADAGFHFDLNAVGGQVEEFNIRTRSTLLGRWWKNVRLDEQGLRRGHDIWLGAQLAWDFFQKKPIVPYDGHDLGMKDQWFPRERPTQYTDKIASVHFPGPTVSVTTYAGRLRTRFDAGAALNFSMVNSLPFNLYSATHDTWGVKTTLQNWGYYYALGTTLTARAEAEIGAWRAAAGVDYRRFSSIQGLDRYQDHVTDDGRLTDSRLVSSASLTARFPQTPVFAAITVDRIDRRGSFHQTIVSAHEARFTYQIGVSF